MPPQPDRVSFDDVIANLTEKAPSREQLAALSPGECLAALARSVVGLSAERAPAEKCDLYLDVICPERKAFASSATYKDINYWRTVSACALVARSVLRRYGIRSRYVGLEEGDVPRAYNIGRAVSDLVQVGIDQNAWVNDPVPPPLGAIVVIGTGIATHAFINVATVGDDMVCESVDGGQVVAAESLPGKPVLQLQGILGKRRQISRTGAALSHDGRIQIGFIDPDRLKPAAQPTFDLL